VAGSGRVTDGDSSGPAREGGDSSPAVAAANGSTPRAEELPPRGEAAVGLDVYRFNYLPFVVSGLIDLFMAFHLFLQVDWMNKFIFDMWPFLDKVLITNDFSVLFPASSICVMYKFG
jgi:hypothetical protein